jgi:hypothetical protein
MPKMEEITEQILEHLIADQNESINGNQPNGNGSNDGSQLQEV